VFCRRFLSGEVLQDDLLAGLLNLSECVDHSPPGHFSPTKLSTTCSRHRRQFCTPLMQGTPFGEGSLLT